MVFVIVEDSHAEDAGRFRIFESAVKELRRRVRVPFDEQPIRPPCIVWHDCDRDYHIREYSDSDPAHVLSDVAIVHVTARGVTWAPGFRSDRRRRT
jgi:hypothetical protein